MLDIKYYLQQLNLRNFKDKGSVINFSCPYCGDSESNPYKRRGYIFFFKGSYIFKCHNCGHSRKFKNFLRDQNISVYEEYIFDKFKKNVHILPPPVVVSPPSVNSVPLDALEPISELPDTHIAVQYLKGRKVPQEAFERLFFVGNFKRFVNRIDSTKFKYSSSSDKRIVFPGYNKQGEIIIVQGRTIEDDKYRYLSYKLNDNYPKIFGLERICADKDIWVTEGPLDSLFIDNSLSIGGADLGNSLLLPLDPILIFDNEPRNPNIVKRMKKSIDKGFRIVIHNLDERIKDINDMVIENVDVMSYLRKRVFKGFEAKLELSSWSRIDASN